MRLIVFSVSLTRISTEIKMLRFKCSQNAYLVADAALYIEANLKELNETDNELLFITRAPSKIKEVSAIIKQAKNDEFKPIKDQYSGVMYDFEYGGVKQKIVVVKSSEANKRVIKVVDD